MKRLDPHHLDVESGREPDRTAGRLPSRWSWPGRRQDDAERRSLVVLAVDLAKPGLLSRGQPPLLDEPDVNLNA